jgi:hypothetical protein
MIIWTLDDRSYDISETNKISLDPKKGIVATRHNDGRILSIQFPLGWTKSQAHKYVSNRDLNKVYFRRDANGKVLINRIRLAEKIDQVVSDKELSQKILGDKYDVLAEIEVRNGGEIPFLVGVVAMNFDGQDKIVANNIEFDRKKTVKMIDDFTNLPIHLGHLGMFEDYKDRVGNTVAASVDKEGNPFTWSYIYPHGKGAEFREDLLIAASQGLLGSHRVSMSGDPIDYEVVDKEDDDYGQVDVRINEWKPESQDFVFAEAISGSRAVSIVNSELQYEPEIDENQGGNELTLSEILAALKEYKTIALSDLLQIDAVKVAIDEHTKILLSNQKSELKNDEEFAKEVIDSCGDSVLSESDRVEKIVDIKMSQRKEKIDSSSDKIITLAKENGIELNDGQAALVRMNLNGKQDDAEIVGIVKSAAMFTGLDSIKGKLFTKSDNETPTKIEMSEHGSSIREVDPSKRISDLHT